MGGFLNYFRKYFNFLVTKAVGVDYLKLNFSFLIIKFLVDCLKYFKANLIIKVGDFIILLKEVDLTVIWAGFNSAVTKASFN